tara:strand:+ start:5611 stop:6186 length:576 start_codon:yes stop_codon:yes gene_type:complete
MAGKKRKQFFDLRCPKHDRPIYLDELGSQLKMKGVVYSGNGHDIYVPLPEFQVDDQDTTVHLVPDDQVTINDWVGILQATDDPEIFELDASGATKAVHRKLTRAIGAEVQWQVYCRDDYCCVYCSAVGGGSQRMVLSVDHFVPIELGGNDEMSNLVTACRRCNKNKGSQHPKIFLHEAGYLRIKMLLEKQS